MGETLHSQFPKIPESFMLWSIVAGRKYCGPNCGRAAILPCAMTLAEDVLMQLSRNGRFLNSSVTFKLEDVQLMVAFVRNHLATRQEPINRAGLNAKLREYEQDWTDCGFKTLGFCYVVIANQLLPASSHLSTEVFTRNYPKYAVGDPAEVDQALTLCNMMISALKILSAQQSKGALIEIVTRICKGPDGKVKTGGRKSKVSGEKYTLKAEAFYVKESGFTPKSRGGSGEGAAELVRAQDPAAQGGHSESESSSSSTSSSSQGSKRSNPDSDDDSMSTHESAGTKFACLSLASASPSPGVSPHHVAVGSSSPPVLLVLAIKPFLDAAETGANAAAELSCDTDPFDPDSFEIDADLVGFGSGSESDSDQFQSAFG